ncbi:hypothetical protein BH10BAC3_BH10BAC3_13000 [soil metagenome]
MKVLIYVSFLFVIVISCKKEVNKKPESFLVLGLQGQEEDIRWEAITANWNESVGIAEMEATSYYFDRCIIHFRNISGAGEIKPVTLAQFYYTDGLDFVPYAISGALTITRQIEKKSEVHLNCVLKKNTTAFQGIL